MKADILTLIQVSILETRQFKSIIKKKGNKNKAHPSIIEAPVFNQIQLHVYITHLVLKSYDEFDFEKILFRFQISTFCMQPHAVYTQFCKCLQSRPCL